jgi:hypothetical protein
LNPQAGQLAIRGGFRNAQCGHSFGNGAFRGFTFRRSVPSSSFSMRLDANERTLQPRLVTCDFERHGDPAWPAIRQGSFTGTPNSTRRV